MAEFPKLFEPLDLGPMTLRNGFTMTPHTREIEARKYAPKTHQFRTLLAQEDRW